MPDDGLQKGVPRILDLCCGAGYESMRMANLGARVVDIDLSENSIAIARARNPQQEFHVDGVVCIAGLVHLPVEQLRPAFDRMSAVLKPNSRALFTVREGVSRQEARSVVEIDGECYDRAFYAHTLDELQQASAGRLVFEREIEDAEPSLWRNYVFCKSE